MSDIDTKYLLAKALVEEWANKKGHDQCHYYPDIFRKLVEVFEIEYEDPELPPRCEFKEGCRQYQIELYGPEHTFVKSDLPDYLL